MNRIEQMIHDLCVNGVKRVKLGDYFTRIKGTPITAGVMKEIANENGDVRIFAGGKTIVNAFEKDIPNANITKVPAVLVQSRGVIDFVYYDKPFTFKNEMWAYTHTEITTLKYLYYYCKNDIDYFRTAAGGMGSMPQISLPITENYSIPLPPLEIQTEIVKILDRFAVLTAELEAELENQKKRYEYYRTRLLSFAPDSTQVQWRALGEVATIITGGEPPTDCIKTTLPEGEYKYPVWGNGQDVYGFSKTFQINRDCAVISSIGANTGAIYYRKAYFTPIIRLKVIVPREGLLSKYLYFYLSSKNIKPKSGTVPNLNTNDVKAFLIPIPSLAEQERIVNILDKFDQLVNGVKDSIPELIDKVQKQYEYYRNKLLTFPEA